MISEEQHCGVIQNLTPAIKPRLIHICCCHCMENNVTCCLSILLWSSDNGCLNYPAGHTLHLHAPQKASATSYSASSLSNCIARVSAASALSDQRATWTSVCYVLTYLT